MVLRLQKLELVLNPVTGFSHCEFKARLSRLVGALRKRHVDWWPRGAQPPLLMRAQLGWDFRPFPSQHHGERLGEPSGLSPQKSPAQQGGGGD